MAQNQTLPLGSGLGAIRAPSLQGDANEAAFRRDASSGGILGQLLSKYPTQQQAIDARKAAQSRISDILGGLMGAGSAGSEPMFMPDESSGMNIDGSEPTQTPFYLGEAARDIGGQILKDLRGAGRMVTDAERSILQGLFTGPNIKTGKDLYGDEFGNIAPDGTMPRTMNFDVTDVSLGDEFGNIAPDGSMPRQTTEITSVADDLAAMAGEEAGGLGEANANQALVFSESSTKENAVTGGGTTTGGGKTGEQINRDLYQGLLDQSLKSYNEAVGMAPPKAQTMQEYKDEFSKATGIDISGDPDNKAALTAFGLALMQNKAGKGFNVGKMLSEVGAAGEKALPLMEQARREAREAQVAAGKYALTEGKTATATRQKFLVDQANYLRDRRDTILGAQVTRINQIEDREDKQAAAANLASAKTKYDAAVKEIEWRIDAEKALAEGKEIKSMLKQEPISGNKQYVIHKGMPKSGGQLVLTDAQNDAKKFGRGYGNILEAQNTIDNSIRILKEIESSPMGSTAESLVESAQSLFKSLVPQNPNNNIFKDVAIYNTDGSITLKQGISKEALLESMRNGIISEYKRFLTQETGNGISEGDVERINQLLGKPGAFKNIAEAIAGLQEARGIFDTSRLEFEDALAQFTDRTNYDSDEAFKLGSTAAQQGIFYGIGNRGNNYQAIDFSKLPIDDASGLPVFDLTK